MAGLDASAPVAIDELELADGPLVLVVGSEGQGLSRLIGERCDVMASIPMHRATDRKAFVALVVPPGRPFVPPGVGRQDST